LLSRGCSRAVVDVFLAVILAWLSSLQSSSCRSRYRRIVAITAVSRSHPAAVVAFGLGERTAPRLRCCRFCEHARLASALGCQWRGWGSTWGSGSGLTLTMGGVGPGLQSMSEVCTKLNRKD
jgi:hypothetical protein